MEEEKQSRVHLDLAQLIVNKLADGESHVTQEAALKVLKPLLEGHIGLAILKRSEIPENWFTNDVIQNNDLINELSAYLQKIKFSMSEFFIEDLKEKYEQFKAKIYINNQKMETKSPQEQVKQTETIFHLLQSLQLSTERQQINNNSIQIEYLNVKSMKGYSETVYADSYRSHATSSQPGSQNIEYSDQIVEFNWKQEEEIEDYLNRYKHKEQLIKIRESEIKVYYLHSAVLRLALKTWIFDDLLNAMTSNDQNIYNQDDITLREKLQLLIPKNDTLCDIKLLCLTKYSILYQISENQVAKQALIRANYDKERKIRQNLNNVYQAQMQILSGVGPSVHQFFLFDEKNALIDHIWSISYFNVLTDEIEFTSYQLSELCFLTINCIAVEYHQNNLFHGDIKPDNIFFNKNQGGFFLTSDVGSLLYLGEANEQEGQYYIVTQYTEKYSSPKHIEAVKKKSPLTRQQLMQEDKYQLRQTLISFFKNQNEKNTPEKCISMLSYFGIEAMSIIQIRNYIIFQNFDFAISKLRQYASYSNQFEKKDSTAIQKLEKYVYFREDIQDNLKQEKKSILDHLDQQYQAKLVKFYLEYNFDFNLPLTSEGSNYLQSLGIKEQVVTWKQWYDQILEELVSKDEDDESIKKFKVMLDSFQFLQNKDSFISLLYVLFKSSSFAESKNRRSKKLAYDKFEEVSNNLQLSKEEKYQNSYCLKDIKKFV